MEIKKILESYSIDYKVSGDDGVLVRCPNPEHPDKNPSFNITLSTGICRCWSCSYRVQFHEYLTHDKAAGVSKSVALAIVADRRKKPAYIATKSINEDVDRLKRHSLREELTKRAVETTEIFKYKLGVSKRGDRLVIPVEDYTGQFYNRRFYAPGKKDGPKFINVAGQGTPLLYPFDQLEKDKLFLCGGEIKALAVISHLRKFDKLSDYGAISSTGGETHGWRGEFNVQLMDKDIVIVYDIDSAGMESAFKIAEQLHKYAHSVRVLRLPLDIKEHPTGDVNDYLSTVASPNLIDIARKTKPFEFIDALPVYSENVQNVPLAQVVLPKYDKHRIATKGELEAISKTTYRLPSRIEVKCHQDRKQGCAGCVVFESDAEEKIFPIPSEHELLPEIIESTTKLRRLKLCGEAAGVLKDCKSNEIESVTTTNVEKLHFKNAFTTQVFYNVTDQITSGKGAEYEIEGRALTNHDLGQPALVASNLNQLTDTLDTYKLSDPEPLKIFQPNHGDITGKLNEIYSDLMNNVTHIYNREELHFAIDLAYHSPLYIKNKAGIEQRGWVEVMIVGDTGQGKSQAVTSLMHHYGLGSWVDCAEVTTAGLLGGAAEMSGEWGIRFGEMPRQDRKLLVLEEFKLMKSEVWEQCRNARSAGRVKIAKIEADETECRTRMIALSNPKGEREMDTYDPAMTVVKGLVKNNEDIRRFDFFYLVHASDVPVWEIQEVEHKYTKELCNELLLWAWSLDEVVFEDNEHTQEVAKALQKSFSNSPILIDCENKLRRLASSLAARLFSCDPENYQRLIVKRIHVEYMAEFIEKYYASNRFGLPSKGIYQSMDEKIIERLLRDELLREIARPDLMLKHLIQTDTMTIENFRLRTEQDRAEAELIFSQLVNAGAYVGDFDGAHKSREFSKYLRELDNSREFSKPDFLDKKEPKL